MLLLRQHNQQGKRRRIRHTLDTNKELWARFVQGIIRKEIKRSKWNSILKKELDNIHRHALKWTMEEERNKGRPRLTWRRGTQENRERMERTRKNDEGKKRCSKRNNLTKESEKPRKPKNEAILPTNYYDLVCQRL